MNEAQTYVALTILGMVLTTVVYLGLEALGASAAVMAVALALTWTGMCLWVGVVALRYAPEYRDRRR